MTQVLAVKLYRDKPLAPLLAMLAIILLVLTLCLLLTHEEAEEETPAVAKSAAPEKTAPVEKKTPTVQEAKKREKEGALAAGRHRFHGMVADQETYYPITEYTLTLYRDEGSARDRKWVAAADPLFIRDVMGRFQMDHGVKEPGSYQLRAEAEGYFSNRSITLQVSPEEDGPRKRFFRVKRRSTDRAPSKSHGSRRETITWSSW